ncbi:Endopolyphosphatase [Tieghemiomyces parasiticus]|uniref:Endopolyphosphatase n=1 Tax=Tieghemiomyces parasiticus TaxID=78921 RepID=A0A9W8E057_9FUNG|nr:Endopolyphosphatase [Tieghemiomyces parasiticus]
MEHDPLLKRAPAQPTGPSARARSRLVYAVGGLLIGAGLALLWHAASPITVGVPAADRSAPPATLVIQQRPQVDTLHLRGNFLHVTDLHLDSNYLPGATLDSYCHRPPKKHQESDVVSGQFGAPVSSCDSPASLIDITFNWINRTVHDQLDFVVFTGDSARHERDEKLPRSVEEVTILNRYIASKFMAVLDPIKVPVIHVVGNNDIEPHNMLEPGPNRMLEGLYQAWKEYIPDDQRDTYLTMGYYTRELVPGRLRAVALNTQWFYSSNDFVGACRKSHHPGSRQLRWLEDILRQAASSDTDGQEGVIIVGHVAPEDGDYFNSCYKQYARLVARYRDTIRGQFFGHNNKDHFYFLAGDGKARRTRTSGKPARSEIGIAADQPVHVARRVPSVIKELLHHYRAVWADRDRTQFTVLNVAPSVVPVYNPAIRVMKYQVADGTIPARRTPAAGDLVHITQHQRPPSALPFATMLDYDQFWLNLTAANDEFDNAQSPGYYPDYELLYSARRQYDIPDLTFESYLDMSYRMVHNVTLRRQFAEFFCVMAGLQEDSYL